MSIFCNTLATLPPPCPSGGDNAPLDATRCRSRSPPRFGRSKLCERFILDWAWGKLSATDLLDYVSLARDDGLENVVIQRLSSLSPEHASRSLLRWLGAKDMMSLKHRVVGARQQCMILPHVLYSHLATRFPGELSRRFGGDEGKLSSFWSAFVSTSEGEKFLSCHPWLKDQDLRFSIPLKIHVDAGPFTKTRSTYVCSWVGLLGIGSEIECNFHVASWEKTIKDSVGESPFWDELYWSFECMSRGVWPETDASGKPFPPGSKEAAVAGTPLVAGSQFRPVLLFCKGDMEFFANELGLAHYHGNSICSWCGCDRQSLPWSDFSDNAAWRGQIFRNPDFLAKVLSR